MGRVLPSGSFPTPDTALEYLYGILCDIPGFFPRPYIAVAASLNRLLFDTGNYLASADITLRLNPDRNLTFFSYMAFDKHHRICGYDAQIRNLGITVDFPPETHPATIQALCQGIQETCTGDNQQYENFEDCVDFMTNKTPYGSSDQLDQDSVSCRTLHIQLAALAPDVHCPHCGPMGGEACTNKTSQSYYEVDYLSCAYKRKTHYS
ncbi:unnamed protein product [Didymodactylos carnosus]|uniref:Uncharacterized protein n=1 Tax=Didymodactylos carnosus TaxID=1234261 RepID=A0A8S2ENG8_9BILA|nr:unnamed protein product [Didymodactylos carnosus]CAF4004327.1 unnamed protein product [Didymodactylos carnosus]